jgi:hypothetical protein
MINNKNNSTTMQLTNNTLTNFTANIIKIEILVIRRW